MGPSGNECGLQKKKPDLQYSPVDKVFLSIDQDRTVCNTIKKISEDFGSEFELYFANGGDQNNNTIPEKDICDKLGIKLIDGLGDKIQSSSWLLK